MNAKQRYDLEHPIISFRVDKNLRKIISEYMGKHEIETMQKFVELLIEGFKRRKNRSLHVSPINSAKQERLLPTS